MKILKYSVDSYVNNSRWIILFSIALLVAFMIPLFISMPTYPAVGSIFLRTGSIPALTMFDFGIMLVAFLISLYLVSFAIVNINIIIKSQRTTINIKKEVLDSITTSAFSVFLLYILYSIALFVILLLFQTLPISDLIISILSLLISLPFFYAPAAMVIDNISMERSLSISVKRILHKPSFFVLWLVLSLILLSIVTVIGYNFIPSPYGPYFVILLNSLFVLPFIIVLQSQMYLSKYTILS